ncbi:DUF262 domain-containing protein [Nonomuraea sp. B12E4]|uniref:DUF262 domain-containing protein n=1 Tax=Nonomuraea sp. B12E4 TaxID=3153564 RepID=UPI00325EC942
MEPGFADNFEKQLTAERQKVDVAVHNFSVRELVRMMVDGELNAAPAYQRQFRWDEEGESLFIESVFLGLPAPPIFVATNVGYQWEVVDGVQRLSTLAHFLAEDNEAANKVRRETPLVLKGLEKLSDLNGASYAELPRNIQVYFGRQPLQIISLTDKSDLLVRFDVFERLNRGGIRLTPQEVRACVYRGKFNDFIEKLAEDESFNSLLKLKQTQQHDGTIIEEVLKYFAYKNFRERFDGKIEKWLNRYMGAATKEFDYRREEKTFNRATSFLHEVCDGPFMRSGSNVTPVVQFEACLVSIAELLQEGKTPVAPPAGWQDDSELRASSGAGSNAKQMLIRRLARAKELFGGEA